jgi:hypothetical protein
MLPHCILPPGPTRLARRPPPEAYTDPYLTVADEAMRPKEEELGYGLWCHGTKNL